MPTFTGEEDEEIITQDIFSPGEIEEVQPDDAPTQEDNETNEADIKDFLDSIAEHAKESAFDNGDVLGPNDYEDEFRGSPLMGDRRYLWW